MFLKVSQSYHVVVTLASLRPSQMEAKGIVLLQRGIGDGASEGSSSAEAGYRESMGLRTEIESGVYLRENAGSVAYPQGQADQMFICVCFDQPNRRIRDPYVRWCGRGAQRWVSLSL